MLSNYFWDILALLRLARGLLISLMTGLLLTILAGQFLRSWAPADVQLVQFVLALLSFQGMAVVLIAVFLREQRLSWRDTFGLTRGSIRSLLVWAAATAAILIALALPLNWFCTTLLTWLGLHVEPQSAVQVVQSTSSASRLGFYGVMAILLVPPAEELLFRGVMYPVLKSLGFRRLAWWGTALFFGLAHLNPQALIPLTMMGLVLTWLYERTQNLLAPILAHSLFNAFNFLLLALLVR